MMGVRKVKVKKKVKELERSDGETKSRMKNNGKGGVYQSPARNKEQRPMGGQVPEERRNWCQAKDLRG